jgi:hypothetical protein
MKKEKIIEKIKNGELNYNNLSVFKRKDIDIIKAYVEVATPYDLEQFATKNKNNEKSKVNGQYMRDSISRCRNGRIFDRFRLFGIFSHCRKRNYSFRNKAFFR